MYLVLIETSGNQRYIFATNKLRENVGASELTYRVGTERVEKAIEGKAGVRKIIVTSGKALLLVDQLEVAKKIVSDVTKEALTEMPGLTVHGAISPDFQNIEDVHKAIGEAHCRLEEIRFNMPSTDQRFLRLPFVAPCSTSGLPASSIEVFYEFDKQQGTRKEIAREPFSQVTQAKRNALCTKSSTDQEQETFRKSRIVDMLQTRFGITLFENLDDLEKHFKEKLKWLSVIHADGNGVGDIFLRFDKNSGKTGEDYIKDYRDFSDALDICTINAVGHALRELQKCFVDGPLPVVPLILGGDDLTLLCDGQYALKFTKDFLEQFEEETENLDKDGHFKETSERLKCVIPRIADNAFGNQDEKEFSVKRLGICAGVAIVKPHYPFHQAYELAEQLLKSAKEVKTKVQSNGKQFPCSAFDFHIVYDSTNADLDNIRRDKLTVDGDETKLFAKPYVVTKTLKGQDNNAWLTHRKFEELKNRVEAMIAPAKEDTTRRALPNSKLHEIRQSLFRGKEVAAAEATLIENRLSDEAKKHFTKLKCGDSIFFNEDGNNTHFLDAIEAVDFWKGFKPTPESEVNK